MCLLIKYWDQLSCKIVDEVWDQSQDKKSGEFRKEGGVDHKLKSFLKFCNLGGKYLVNEK